MLVHTHLDYIAKVTYESSRRTQGARVHAFQNKMLIHGDALRPVLRWSAPSQEHHSIRPDLRHGVDNLLRQELPAFSSV